ncbi:MAG: amino acid adenylation domain-containing protein [Clostridia bacterium]|nr:amino acid adenylation domain-containing protein [Clostridia bacterium]
MQTNVLEYLEKTVQRLPDKVAFANESTERTFREVYLGARAIGSQLARDGFYHQPIVVYMKKHPDTVIAFFGAVYGGNYYVPLDEEMPQHRIELILNTLQPKAMICDADTAAAAQKLPFSGKLYLYDEISRSPVDDAALQAVRKRQLDTDPIYIVFTSGSTGIPKGVAACHRSVLDYIENLSEVLEFNEDTVFGNQTPLYFDACLKELYPTLKFGATTYIIPKSLFMFPIKLVEFLNEKKINTVCWVVSALTMISAFKTFDKIKPQYLYTVAFGSEVFPIKQFNIWKSVLPQAKFTNLYGPTEATGMCCYFKVERDFAEGETLPIGGPFRNTEILLLNEQNEEAKPGETGEICVRGTSLTLGYYNNFEKTNEVYVQNPLNPHYPELIYRTGDLAKYNERGELLFLSRKDYQIKHMGHRIELGEIEVVVNMLDGVKSACCIFDDVKKKIVLYYTGDPTTAEMALYLREKLPRYMIPNIMEQLPRMPLTANGKIDRVLLKQNYMAKQKG